MLSENTLTEIWRVTRPAEDKLADEYRGVLHRCLITSKINRYLDAFEVAKKNGSSRKIVPAGRDLAFVQRILAEWLVKLHPNSKDYCYTRKGVLSAASAHVGSTKALVIDLKSAFDHITASKLKFAIRRESNIRNDVVLNAITDLLVYPVYDPPAQQTTPQGCVSTPYAFNLVMQSVDQHLELIRQMYKGIVLTRYSDNIAFSTTNKIDLAKLEKHVKSVITANGFEISWAILYEKPPFSYLGTLVDPSGLKLDYDKYQEYLVTLTEAIQNPTPKIYHRQILGMFNWTKRVCGNEVPEDLYILLVRYFEKIRMQPESLGKLVIARSNLQLPNF